ncbi:MAG: HNH endonuclease [Porphyromonas sp.]|nr:HNH endonuclease [Porphyromonas sp.]
MLEVLAKIGETLEKASSVITETNSPLSIGEKEFSQMSPSEKLGHLQDLKRALSGFPLERQREIIGNLPLNIQEAILQVDQTRLPRNGTWDGEVGNSLFTPNPDYVPPSKTAYNNPDSLSMGQIMEKYGITGVRYNYGYPDFTPVARETVILDDIGSFYRHEADRPKGTPIGNSVHERAFSKLAEQKGMSLEEVRAYKEKNNLVIHECGDGKTVQFVPREIHDNLSHSGGIEAYKKMENHCRIDPWIGKNYNEGIGGKRIIGLGEGHYCASPSDARPTLTQEIIVDLFDKTSPHEGYKNTYTKFAKALVGPGVDSVTARELCYNSIGFYNYVQEPISGARIAPTKEQFESSAPAFRDMLEQQRPERVIAWGKRLYEALPSDGYALPDLEVDGKSYRRWCYTLSDGFAVPVLEMTHPSAAYSPEEWNKVIKVFLQD